MLKDGVKEGESKRLKKKRMLKHRVGEAARESKFMSIVTDDILLEIMVRLPDAKTPI